MHTTSARFNSFSRTLDSRDYLIGSQTRTQPNNVYFALTSATIYKEIPLEHSHGRKGPHKGNREGN